MPRPKGLPKTGGRIKGSGNKTTLKRSAEASKVGDLPHEMLLAIARGEKVNGHDWNPDQQLDAMHKSAPYYASRFATKVGHTGANGGPISMADISSLTDVQLAALAPILAALAGAAGAPPRSRPH